MPVRNQPPPSPGISSTSTAGYGTTRPTIPPRAGVISAPQSHTRPSGGRPTPETQTKPAEPPRGSPLLPEPLKPQTAGPAQPTTTQTPPVLRMQEPLIPVSSHPPQTSAPQSLEPPQPPPRSRSSQSLPSESAPSQQQIKTNGAYGTKLETQLNSDPFEDLSFKLLVSKMQTSVRTSPVPALNQKELIQLPSATQRNADILNTLNCMPAMPPIPTFNTSQEHKRSSPNPFITGLNCTNPFTERTPNAGNPFRTETQESEITSPLLEGRATCNPFPSLNPLSCNTSKPVFSVNASENTFCLPGKSVMVKNVQPKGWVTFDDDDDNFNVKLKPSKSVPDIKQISSRKSAGSPDLLGTEQNTFLGSDFNFDNDWNKSSTDCFYTMPARRPPAPPIPSRVTSNRSPADAFTSLAPKVSPTQDFTER